ncbi:hypothetical protein B0H14DRAFT_3507605 [Mycena olivaceomarginata]|nr:hypothetical protein B0H14DRAFT_3507605 [Mycena olivaceomarginata]
MPKDNTKSSPRSKPKAKATTRTWRANVKSTATDKETSKRKAGSPSEGSDSGTAHKKPRVSGATGTTNVSGVSAATGAAQASGTANPNVLDEDQDEEMIEEILTKELADTRLAFLGVFSPRRFPREQSPPRGPSSALYERCVVYLSKVMFFPSAKDKLTHYDKHFDEVNNIHVHVRRLVEASRTTIREATVCATTIRHDAERLSGPIDDIARISAQHLSSAFMMVLKAGLKGFCPDVDGPVQSTYNQLHRHLAASAFQFLSSTFGLAALNVNNFYGNNYELLCDMYNNFVFGTLAQNTKMERRRPGSLTESQKNSTAYKARACLSRSQFDTAHRLKMRKPVQRMAYVQETHSDDECNTGVPWVHDKPGRNPTVTRVLP